ncbi:hypothetical protein PYCC9005_002696 [Savitreella phatthalungensis]
MPVTAEDVAMAAHQYADEKAQGGHEHPERKSATSKLLHALKLIGLTAVCLTALSGLAPASIAPNFPFDRTSSCTARIAELETLGAKFLSNPTVNEALFIENPTFDSLNRSLFDYTRRPHLAGNHELAKYTRDRWLDAGLQDVEIVRYDVLLNYPTNRSSLTLWAGKQIEWTSKLKEDPLPEDEGSEQDVPFFHGYSKNGSASGKLVYLNYARREDFDMLVELQVDLKGKVGIARYGKSFRGIKVELAEKHGMSGILLYDDPSEDGEITVENGYEAYPNGPARNPSAVQRGSVQALSLAPGDPTTPGYASIPGAERKDPKHAIPGIPSLPISGNDAQFLLRTLNGPGEPIPDFVGGFSGVDYNAESLTSPFEVRFDNVVDYDIRPIYNVIARVRGHWDDLVVLGNHRDAWVRGASDPNSGSTALDSVADTLGSLTSTGFVPLRSIILASWDAEEYGLVGSTEWVEEHADELNEKGAVYLNVDVASSGQQLRVSATPLLFSVIHNTTKLVPALEDEHGVPGTAPKISLADTWSGKISTLGSGSDYTAFQDFIGVSSTDIGFTSNRTSPAYHYHSQYDSHHWLTTFGDPGLKALQAATRLWGVLAIKLAETPVVALNATLYGTEIVRYVKELGHILPLEHVDGDDKSQKKGHHKGKKDKDKNGDKDKKKHKHGRKLYGKLERAASHVAEYGVDLDTRAAVANGRVKDWPKLSAGEQEALLREIAGLNEEYRALERGFLDKKHGLPGRSWYKSLIYAPGRWTGYAGAVFPSIVEASPADEVWHEVARVTKLLKHIGRPKN